MRDSWTETTLSEVLLPVVTRAKDNSEYEVLSVTERRGIIPQTEVFNHRIATEDISKYKVLQPGDIAFNPYLLWCGAVGQWKGNYEGVVSPVYECFRARDTDLPRFIGLIFESGVLTPYFDSTAIGSIVRRRRTTLPVFYEAPIIRPPLVEQKRIVDVVSSVDAYIDALQQQADTARTARNAVLHELLSAGGDDWTETTLGDVAEYINGYPFKPSDLGEEGTAVIRIKQLLDPMEKVDRTILNVPERCILRDGDIVFSWSGTLAVRVWNRGSAYLNQHLFRVVEKSGVSHEWLPLVLDHAIEDLVEKSHGTTMKHITKQTLLPHQVFLPPVDEQKRIVEIVSSMDEVIQSTEQAVVDAKNLRSGLLSDLLSGEHEIPASYDVFVGAA